MKTFFRWFFRIFLGLFLCLVLFVTVLAVFKIPINLSRFKAPVEAIATKAIDRPVTLEGDVILSTSLTPYFSIQGLKVSNPEGFEQDYFLSLGQVRLQVSLLPLLKRKIHIPEFKVEKLNVILEELDDGNVNWVFTTAKKAGSAETTSPDTDPDKTKATAQKKERNVAGDTIVVENLLFSEIEVTLFTPEEDEPKSFTIDECIGSMVPGEPLKLDMKGELVKFPYKLGLSIASLEEFLTENQSWMDFQFQIAETTLSFSGNIDLATSNRLLTLETKVSGKSLASLNELLKVDLPPIADYSASTRFSLEQGRFHLKNLSLKTGESSLVGEAEVVRNEEEVFVEAVFTSPLIQLDDFVFEDWSYKNEEEVEPPAEEEKVAEQKQPEEPKTQSGENVRKLFDPELLNKYDLSLKISSEKVLSGEDLLGSGLLHTSLKDGRIAIEPLELQVPGGGIVMTTSFKPDATSSEATFKAKIENFDIGVVVRRSKPEAKMAGLVNLDIDLKSTASKPEEIFANGNGYFDFSGHLDNIASGIIDLWAVNLVAAIVSSTDENQSEINCAVGKWTVTDGILTPDIFFIDTSKIRICGDGQVDFGQQKIDITVGPTPKRPEFFNLATPVKINGTFDDINFGVGSIVGTAIKFITSPVHVPIRRLVTEDIPEDGSDACAITLGPENRTEEVSIRGCN